MSLYACVVIQPDYNNLNEVQRLFDSMLRMEHEFFAKWFWNECPILLVAFNFILCNGNQWELEGFRKQLLQVTQWRCSLEIRSIKKRCNTTEMVCPRDDSTFSQILRLPPHHFVRNKTYPNTKAPPYNEQCGKHYQATLQTFLWLQCLGSNRTMLSEPSVFHQDNTRFYCTTRHRNRN